jgi:hypothetical protein
LDDNKDAWLLNSDGTYTLSVLQPKIKGSESVLSAQQQLLKKYEN